jgi:hypothetical protein
MSLEHVLVNNTLFKPGKLLIKIELAGVALAADGTEQWYLDTMCLIHVDAVHRTETDRAIRNFFFKAA